MEGADASCFYYSIIESAKCCGLNPARYVEYILRFGPSTSESDYERLLPWNADLSRLDRYTSALDEAKPDPERTEPYILCGFSR